LERRSRNENDKRRRSRIVEESSNGRCLCGWNNRVLKIIRGTIPSGCKLYEWTERHLGKDESNSGGLASWCDSKVQV
jgi:hypothetical protein